MKTKLIITEATLHETWKEPCLNCNEEFDKDDLCPEERHCLDCHEMMLTPACEEACIEEGLYEEEDYGL